MEKKLFRNEQDKTIAGVCTGLAEYINVDPVWVKLAFILATLAGLSGILVYIILWIVIPPKKYLITEGKPFNHTGTAKQPFTEEHAGTVVPGKQKENRAATWFGVFLILLGIYFFLDQLGIIPGWLLVKLWPLALILPGLFILIKSFNRRNKITTTQTDQTVENINQ